MGGLLPAEEPRIQAEPGGMQPQEIRAGEWKEKPELQASKDANGGVRDGQLKSTMGNESEGKRQEDSVQVWVQNMKCTKIQFDLRGLRREAGGIQEARGFAPLQSYCACLGGPGRLDFRKTWISSSGKDLKDHTLEVWSFHSAVIPSTFL